MRLKIHLMGALLLAAFACSGQEFSINKIELTTGRVILHYSLIDTVKGHFYTIHVYSSKDDFIAPLQKVKGDVSIEVRPGANKEIIWNAREEFGTSFNGDVELEVRGRLYVPFVRFDGFQEGTVFKRGKAKTLTWTGGTRQNILNFALFKGDNYVDVIPNVANSGSYDLILPTSIKPGNGYYFMVSDSKNKDQVMKTNPFKVKRKVPLAAKVLPVALVGVAVSTLVGSGGPGTLNPPPDPPNQKN